MTGARSDLGEQVQVAVVIACHNRRDLTVRCLNSLRGAARATDVQVVLVDDGSTDSTAAAAAEAWPGLRLVSGDGNLFWAGAMALGEATARRELPATTHLLWLNDDVVLDQGAVDRLLETSHDHPDAIIAGALRDPRTDEITYSGLSRSGWHPLRYQRVAPDAHDAKTVETFNGNLVLVPVAKAEELGSIDGAFIHQFADLDYGHRATEAGIEVLLAAGIFGSCPRNPASKPSGGIAERWRQFHSHHYFPFTPRKRFLKRHGGSAWWLFLITPYPRLLIGRSKRGTSPAKHESPSSQAER